MKPVILVTMSQTTAVAGMAGARSVRSERRASGHAGGGIVWNSGFVRVTALCEFAEFG